jgi:hypothetical protein
MMISTADLRSHLNITNTDDDLLLDSKIAAASEWVSLYTAIPDPDPDADGPCVIPAPVKEAVRQLAAHLYENREATLVGVTSQSLPFGLLDLLMPYRAWVF